MDTPHQKNTPLTQLHEYLYLEYQILSFCIDKVNQYYSGPQFASTNWPVTLRST